MSGLGTRAEALERLTSGPLLDILVVGGGITGAGIALDAASRGARVGLVERFDFAAGTSSKSSKLVHGGLRYLEQREFGLMREACVERDLLRRLAPHLVEAVPFVFPVSQRSTRAKIGVGMWAYDALATFRNLKFHKHVDGTEAEALLPSLPRGKVRGGYVFYDCKTDDSRLVLENLVQARRYGAVSVNHAAVRDLEGGDTCVATVEDTVTGALVDVRARRIIVAGGVWSDHIEQLANHRASARLRPSKGIHLVFSRDRLPLGATAGAIPDVDRRRMLFVIPWLDHVLVGTTDHAYAGSLDRPTVEPAERDYVIESLNSAFEVELTPDDVAGAYAGLRPLVAAKDGATADLSRRHTVYPIAPGIVGITGGKLTTYRRMAQDAVDNVVEDLGIASRSRTRWIRLGSSDVARLRAALQRRALLEGVEDAAVTGHLVRNYGDRALDVFDLAAAEGALEPIVDGFAPLRGEIAYAARNEMAVHLSDLLSRRTRLALVDRAGGIGARSLAALRMQEELGWSTLETARQIASHRGAIENERNSELAESVVGMPASESSSRTG